MSKIHSKDIAVLCKIIHPAGKHILVFSTDKEYSKNQDNIEELGCTIDFFTDQSTLIQSIGEAPNTVLNLSSQTLEINQKLAEKTTIIQFFQPKKNLSTYFSFDFINNSDKTIRWIYPSKQKNPSFLHLYNGSGKRAWVFSTIFKQGFKFGLKNSLKSGRFWVQSSSIQILDQQRSLGNVDVAVFTGTKGSNRKAVAAYSDAKNPIRFVKMPLAKNAYQLVEREGYYLNLLQNYDFKYLHIPEGKLHQSNLALSNIRPEHSIKNEVLSDTHLLALKELYTQTIQFKSLHELPVWASIKQDIDRLQSAKIVNDLPKSKVQHIWLLLHQLFQTLDQQQAVPTSIAHADFTPWNSYASIDKIHVYDWELADRLPLLYDAFHFIIQTGVLVHHLDHEAIRTQLETIIEHPRIKEIETTFQLNIEQAFQFYLLRNTSYYMARYVQQAHLHQQAHWLLDVWLKTIEHAVTKKTNQRSKIPQI